MPALASSMRAFGTSATGTVKWFNITKGYGFITPDGDVPDVFVHQSNIESNGFRFLKEGERVKFEISQSDRGASATKVTSPTGEPFNRTREQ